MLRWAASPSRHLRLLPRRKSITANLNGDLWFVAPGDILKGRVEPIVWTRMCAAFANAGLSVELLTLYVRRKATNAAEDPWAHGQLEPRPPERANLPTYYGLPKDVQIRMLPTPLSPTSSVVWYRLAVALIVFPYALVRMLARVTTARRRMPLILYGRGYISFLPFLALATALRRLLDVTTVFETTAITGSVFDRTLLPRMDLVVVSSTVLADDVRALGTVADKVLVAPLASNVLDISGSQDADTRPPAPFESIPAPRATYTGKGTEAVHRLLEELARSLAHSSVHVVVVGSNPRRSEIDNLHFVGFVPPGEVGRYHAHSDVLLNVLDPERPIHRHVVPTKLLDYVAAARPVVSMPFPALQELFGGQLPGPVVHTMQQMADAVEVIAFDDRARRLAQDQVEAARARLPSYSDRVALVLNRVRSRHRETGHTALREEA